MRVFRALLVVFVLAVVAQAATITYSDSVGAAQTPLIFTFQLPQFDPSLGALTGVQITFTGAWEGVWATVTNNGTTPATYRVQDTVVSDLTGATIQQLIMTQVLFQNPAWPGLTSLAAGAVHRYPASGSYSGSMSADPTITAPLSAFVGTGFLTFDLVGDNWGSYTGSSQTQYQQAALVAGDLQITYQYGVPEPATLALVGGSLLGIGLLRRRLVRS